MNDYFINTVEKTTDKIPCSLPCSDTDQITDSTNRELKQADAAAERRLSHSNLHSIKG